MLFVTHIGTKRGQPLRGQPLSLESEKPASRGEHDQRVHDYYPLVRKHETTRANLPRRCVSTHLSYRECIGMTATRRAGMTREILTLCDEILTLCDEASGRTLYFSARINRNQMTT